MVNRRQFIKKSANGLAALGSLTLLNKSGLAASSAAEEPAADTLPGKGELIRKTAYPPNYETPVDYFDSPFTPNNLFFVRYHHSVIPEIDAGKWRLHLGGDAVHAPLELSYEQLRNDFQQVEIAALCLCSGNRRSLFETPAPGLQWGHGAMGNARWRGVRLKDVLAAAGIAPSALEVSLAGSDSGVLPSTPNFVKSLPLAKALDENTLIAFEMNGAPLPHWNGYPARLVVPGWTATYWMKHLSAINVISKPLDNFWMKTAYRLPKDRFPGGEQFASQQTETSEPVTEIIVNSLITNLADGQTLPNGRPVEIKGIAWDGGDGIAKVEISTDGGNSWQQASLKQDYGRFSWRQWHFAFTPKHPGTYPIVAKATSRSGASQPLAPIPNPSGYQHNAVQKITVHLA